MAAERETGSIEGFGTVSRTVGTVFRYALLLATLAGIVALVVLLAIVFYDAVQPQTADPGWYVVYGVTLILPLLATLAYLRRETPRGLTVGGIATLIPVMGLLFGSGAAALFVDVISPFVWLAYVVAVAVPVGAIGLLERRRPVRFVVKLPLSLALFGGSIAVLPGAIQSLPIAPMDWLIIAMTLGGPAAAVIWWIAGRQWDRAGAGRTAAIATIVSILVVGRGIGPLVGLDPLPATILAVSTVVPTGVYGMFVWQADPSNRAGLLVPAVLLVGALVGAVLVGQFGVDGPQSWVDWAFLTTGHRNDASAAGIYPALVGSIMLMLIVAGVSFPIGVGAAVYLEEYARDTLVTRFIDVNIANLAGVPSVVYGLLGLGVFVTYLGSAPGTVLVGGLTLALLILPIVIISSREAIRSVPDSQRNASYGMGATEWQTIKNVVLPEAVPGILTGTILALGRAIGETAPLLVIGAAQVVDLPTELSSRVGALPLQIFVWATAFAGPDFYEKALPAGVIVLLVVLLAMNSAAIMLRNSYERES